MLSKVAVFVSAMRKAVKFRMLNSQPIMSHARWFHVQFAADKTKLTKLLVIAELE